MTDRLKPLFGGLAPGLAALEKQAVAAQTLVDAFRDGASGKPVARRGDEFGIDAQ